MLTIDREETKRRLRLTYDHIRLNGLDEKAREEIEDLLELVRKSGEHNGFYEAIQKEKRKC